MKSSQERENEINELREKVKNLLDNVSLYAVNAIPQRVKYEGLTGFQKAPSDANSESKGGA